MKHKRHASLKSEIYLRDVTQITKCACSSVSVYFTYYKHNASMHAKSLLSCLTLCNPMVSSPPGSSVHRIL